MAITLVSGQSFVQVAAHWASSASAAAKSLTTAATAGNLIVVVVSIGLDTENVVSIDDTGTTTYALARRQSDATTGNVLETWWGIAAGAGAGQGVVITKQAATSNVEDMIAIFEFAGNDATQATLQTNGAATASTTTHDSGSVTPGTSDNVLIGISRGSDRFWTVDTDFTSVLANTRTTLGYKIQSSNTAQSYTATSDLGGYSVVTVAAFKGVLAGSTFTLTADQGTYAVTGQAAIVSKGIVMPADQGSYTLVGSNAWRDVEIDPVSGTYVITGQAANLTKDFKVLADQGAYVLLGVDAATLYSGAGPRLLVADGSTYSITGQDVSLRRAARIVSEHGLYNLQGFAVIGGSSPDTGTISGGPFKVRRVLVVSTAGRARWVHYIPVKQATSPVKPGTYNNNGAVEVELLGSGSGLQEWVDYIPVVEVGDSDAGKWRYDNAGWIPILIVE